MNSFDDFFKELTSEEQWFENVSLRHKPETFKTVCKLVWTLALADANQMKVTPMSEHRRHVVYKLSKILPDKDNSKQWFQLEEEKQKKIEEETFVPASPEHKAKCVAEFNELIKNAPMNTAFPRVSIKEQVEEGDWIPKKKEYPIKSDVEKILMLKETKNRIRECRKKVFLEAYPDADEEEIHAYWQQFSDTKDEAI